MLSIVLPTFNERQNIAILIPRLEKLLKENKIDYELVVVDDTSPDGTGLVVKRLMKKNRRIRLLSRKVRNGLGAALRDGYNYSKGDIILSMDTDLCLEESEILHFIDKMKSFDLVVGSRYFKKTYYERKQLKTFVKSVVSRAGNRLNRILSGVPVHDFTLDFRAIKRKAWKAIRTTETTNTFLLEMILKTHYAGFKVGEIPVDFSDRKHGRSKLRLVSILPNFLFKLVYYVFRLRILRQK